MKFPTDLITFTEEIPNGKLFFFCSDKNVAAHAALILGYNRHFWAE